MGCGGAAAGGGGDGGGDGGDVEKTGKLRYNNGNKELFWRTVAREGVCVHLVG